MNLLNVSKFSITALITLAVLFGALISCGSDEKTLVIYSPHKQVLIDLVVDMYKADTGTKVEVITAGTGELLARVKVEAENPNADVFWGGSMNTLLPESSLFEEYRSPNEDNVEDLFKNREGYVTRFSAIPSTIVVNKKALAKLCGPDAEVTGYESIIQLVKTCPALKGRISNANPSKSSSSFEQLINQLWAFAYIEAEQELGRKPQRDEVTESHLEDAWDKVAELVATYDKKHSAGSGAVVTDVVQGETALGLSYEMPSAESAQNSSDIMIVYPEEGSVVKADGAAIIKGAKHMDAAKEFIDYIISSKVQNEVKSVYRRAITKDADFSGSPLAPLNSFRVIEDNGELNNKSAFLEKYSTIFE